jgi:hypothetical protein
MQNGFDDFDSQVTAEEAYADETMVEEQGEMAYDGGRAAEYDAWLSQYDDDPSPYDGTYSEE